MSRKSNGLRDGKVVLITGANSGVGLTTAKSMARLHSRGAEYAIPQVSVGHPMARRSLMLFFVERARGMAWGDSTYLGVSGRACLLLWTPARTVRLAFDVRHFHLVIDLP